MVMKLIEEAKLRENVKKRKFANVAQEAPRKLGEEEVRFARMLTEHQQETFGSSVTSRSWVWFSFFSRSKCSKEVKTGEAE